MQRSSLRLQGRHGELWLEDINAASGARRAWPRRATGDLVAVAHGRISLGPAASEAGTDLTIEVYRAEPTIAFEPWGQVALCSIALPSGRLAISTPETRDHADSPRIALPPGAYRALVCHGPTPIVDDDPPAPATYLVALWPGADIEPTILKRRPR